VTPRTQAKGRRKPSVKRPNRAEKRAANRAQILRAARTVFGKRGFQAATIEEIADEAGLSNGAIYYNFESKGDLFFALLEERQDQRIRHMSRTFANSAPDAALEQEARDATSSLKDSREWRLLLLEFVAHAARTPSLAPKLRAHKRKFRAALTELLEQLLTARGATAALPPGQLALVVSALANGLASEEISDPGSVPDELLGDVLTMLLAPSPSR
jgi:AcrR family transcriptional regulator